MQGTAADLIKLAMVKVQETLDRERRRTNLLLVTIVLLLATLTTAFVLSLL